MYNDHPIRQSAFSWLREQTDLFPDGIPRKKLEEGFIFEGKRITMVGPQGIWKPKEMVLPLSMTTIQNGPYEDSWMGNDLLKYSYRGTNPNHADNTGLRECFRNKIPLVYFLSIHKGWYIAEWPVYIVGDNMSQLSFTIDLRSEQINHLTADPYSLNLSTQGNEERNYKSSTILVRLHQRTFRERVLQAYRSQCALCKLRHRELLDAAHIIGDREAHGAPVVPNGISLCKIHHAAFDSNIIGISPDYKVQVRKDILEEIDGPMLKFGIQELNGNQMILPDQQNFWPDRDRLSERFEKFLKVG